MPDARSTNSNVTIVRVAYRASVHELAAKTLDFSLASIEERWTAGRNDMERALDSLDAGKSTSRGDGYALYDAARVSAAG